MTHVSCAKYFENLPQEFFTKCGVTEGSTSSKRTKELQKKGGEETKEIGRKNGEEMLNMMNRRRRGIEKYKKK